MSGLRRLLLATTALLSIGITSCSTPPKIKNINDLEQRVDNSSQTLDLDESDFRFLSWRIAPYESPFLSCPLVDNGDVESPPPPSYAQIAEALLGKGIWGIHLLEEANVPIHYIGKCVQISRDLENVALKFPLNIKSLYESNVSEELMRAAAPFLHEGPQISNLANLSKKGIPPEFVLSYVSADGKARLSLGDIEDLWDLKAEGKEIDRDTIEKYAPANGKTPFSMEDIYTLKKTWWWTLSSPSPQRLIDLKEVKVSRRNPYFGHVEDLIAYAKTEGTIEFVEWLARHKDDWNEPIWSADHAARVWKKYDGCTEGLEEYLRKIKTIAKKMDISLLGKSITRAEKADTPFDLMRKMASLGFMWDEEFFGEMERYHWGGKTSEDAKPFLKLVNPDETLIFTGSQLVNYVRCGGTYNEAQAMSARQGVTNGAQITWYKQIGYTSSQIPLVTPNTDARDFWDIITTECHNGAFFWEGAISHHINMRDAKDELGKPAYDTYTLFVSTESEYIDALHLVADVWNSHPHEDPPIIFSRFHGFARGFQIGMVPVGENRDTYYVTTSDSKVREAYAGLPMFTEFYSFSCNQGEGGLEADNMLGEIREANPTLYLTGGMVSFSANEVHWSTSTNTGPHHSGLVMTIIAEENERAKAKTDQTWRHTPTQTDALMHLKNLGFRPFFMGGFGF